MEKNIVIKVENLSKIYKIFDKPLDRLKESLHPLKKRYSKDFYALNNVSFSICKGESIGIIGKNGSGKSTLLKILTGVLTPSSGNVLVHGRVAALLELGAGFDPEMTGIENVYMNGMIMGYSRKEMSCKIERILSFADIGDFVYQPVKVYSSGMLVRLAFAVQTEVNPDILIVDEALAVGDALFQKRCFQKINELVSNGTTLLFVSHDQEIVRTMTSRAVFLVGGQVEKIGTSSDVVLSYRRFLHSEEKKYWENITESYKQKGGEIHGSKIINEAYSKGNTTNKNAIEQITDDRFSFGDRDAEIMQVNVFNEGGQSQNVFYPTEKITIKVKIKCYKRLTHLNVALRLRNKEGVKIYSWGTLNQDIAAWSGLNDKAVFWDKIFEENEEFDVFFESICSLGEGLYEIQAAVSEENDRFYGAQRMLHWRDEASFFSVSMKRQEYFFGGISDMLMEAVCKDEK